MVTGPVGGPGGGVDARDPAVERARRREAFLAEREEALDLRARLVGRRTRLQRLRAALHRQSLRR